MNKISSRQRESNPQLEYYTDILGGGVRASVQGVLEACSARAGEERVWRRRICAMPPPALGFQGIGSTPAANSDRLFGLSR